MEHRCRLRHDSDGKHSRFRNIALRTLHARSRPHDPAGRLDEADRQRAEQTTDQGAAVAESRGVDLAGLPGSGPVSHRHRAGDVEWPLPVSVPRYPRGHGSAPAARSVCGTQTDRAGRRGPREGVHCHQLPFEHAIHHYTASARRGSALSQRGGVPPPGAAESSAPDTRRTQGRSPPSAATAAAGPGPRPCGPWR